MMEVRIYEVNAGTPSRYFGLKEAEENEVLHGAPNHWKTEKGAIRWAEKQGLKVVK